MILLVVCSWSACAQPEARHVAEQVDSHYNALRSMKAQFSESYSGTGVERTESGILYLKKPGKMRWEYKAPREKLFLSDGKSAFFYVSGESEARKALLSKLDDLRSPLRYLLGKTRLEKEFDRLELVSATADGNVVLRGVPRSMADRVQQVDLEINKQSQIVRIRIEGTDGTITEFQFSDVAENPELDDALFHFTPPKGVQVIEGEAFQQ